MCIRDRYHTLGLLYLEQGYDTEAEDAFSKAVAAAQETGSALVRNEAQRPFYPSPDVRQG